MKRGQSRVHDACAVASAATSAAKSAAAAVTEKKSLEESAETNFLAWLVDELRSRPDEDSNTESTHGRQAADLPPLCDSILTSAVAGFSAVGQLVFRQKVEGHWVWSLDGSDFLRLSLLILNVTLILMIFDVSWMYHYIRGESFLKLYVLFNMLEMFERWCRSVGVDLFDLLLASARHPWYSLLPKYCATLVYCFVHATMHLIRVILLNVAINTSSNAVFLIIVTNNFAEIKSTVFKRYEEKSLFPIITSDIVERFYLLLDIIFVLARLSISQHSGTFTALDISFWLFLLVVLEIGTDWIKFCLITKFSEMQTKTFEVYREVLLADILLCRCGQLSSISQVGAAREK
ncbi:Protein TAPT1 homolog [Durusdinium trenchii]|uniref:Protein TAPT1 homolog n=1 Tax=Durusdinium trenchii TaxID=1381693 RepID=A0ABP0I7F9_9DINO